MGPGGAQSCSFVMKTNIASVGNKELEPHVQCAGGDVPVVVLGFGRTLEVKVNYFCCAPVCAAGWMEVSGSGFENASCVLKCKSGIFFCVLHFLFSLSN